MAPLTSRLSKWILWNISPTTHFDVDKLRPDTRKIEALNEAASGMIRCAELFKAWDEEMDR